MSWRELFSLPPEPEAIIVVLIESCGIAAASEIVTTRTGNAECHHTWKMLTPSARGVFFFGGLCRTHVEGHRAAAFEKASRTCRCARTHDT